MGGFLVLSFAVFIAGFLTGMLAIALIPVQSDITTLGFMFFILGFVIGIGATLLLIMLRRGKPSKTAKR